MPSLALMMFAIVLFTLTVIRLAYHLAGQLDQQANARALEAKTIYENFAQENEKTLHEKAAQEKEAAEIFMLYEMTKEIAQKVNEEDAFDVFRAKLKENIAFEDCQFVDVATKEEAELDPKECFIFPLKGKNKKLGYLTLKGLSVKDEDKLAILGHQFALALRPVKLYREIEELAITDSLTGVSTRRYFLERFEEELKRSIVRKINLSVLMIDVDHFKMFNDKYGHLAGDQILRMMGKIIKESVREIDIVGRYGGEEICVALPDTDTDGANFAAERIRSSIEEATIKAYDVAVKITVSIGVATFPSDGKAFTELIDKADWALYRAKKKGRNCICNFSAYS